VKVSARVRYQSFDGLTAAICRRRRSQRKGQAYGRAAFRKVDALQTLVGAIKLFEPCAGRRQAQSARGTLTFCTAKSGSRIRNLQQQRVFLATGAYSDAPGSAPLGNTVHHSILDQGLQNQTGNERAGDFRLNVFNETQTIGKSDSLDLEVVRDELYFHF